MDIHITHRVAGGPDQPASGFLGAIGATVPAAPGDEVELEVAGVAIDHFDQVMTSATASVIEIVKSGRLQAEVAYIDEAAEAAADEDDIL